MKEFRTLLVRTYSTSLSAYRNQTIEVKPLKMGAGRQGSHGAHRGDPAGRPADSDRLRDGEGRHGLEGLRRRDRRRLARHHVPRHASTTRSSSGGIDGLVKTLAERNAGPAPAPAAAQEVSDATRAARSSRSTARSRSRRCRDVLEESAGLRRARPNLPERLTIDFAGVDRGRLLGGGAAARVAAAGRAPRQDARVREPSREPHRPRATSTAWRSSSPGAGPSASTVPT